MKIKVLFTVVAIFLFISFALADSPLTSTDFSEAYKDTSIIIEISKAGGEFSLKYMDYLADENNPIDLKMALINKIGWNISGKSNSIAYLNYLIKRKGYANKQDFIDNGSGHELLCMAYLKALDDYFNVDEAIIYANAALERNSRSYTFNIIAALIKAQKAMDGNWCDVYKLTNNVRSNKKLKMDMKKEAIDIIFEYMDIYKDNCDK